MADSQKAIRDLMQALWLFAADRDQGEQPAVPIHIGPVGSEHTVYVTAATAQALADLVDGARVDTAGDGEDADEDAAFDSLIRDRLQGIEDIVPIDEDRMARSTACFTAFLEGQSGEAIETGEWSAATVAHNHRQLYVDVQDLFDHLDYQAVFNTVLDHRQVDLPVAIRALDDVLGDIPAPPPTGTNDDEGGQP